MKVKKVNFLVPFLPLGFILIGMIFLFQGCIVQMFTIEENEKSKGKLLSTYPVKFGKTTITFDTINLKDIKPKYLKKLVNSGVDTTHNEKLILYNMLGRVRKITLFCRIIDGDAIVLMALEQNKSYSELISKKIK
jgi:hypothetical protein